MTIPIRPGPFSFLLGAGQAAGSVGEALIAKRERERQQALQNAGLLAQLITGPNAVLDPTTVAPQVATALGGLGIQGVTPQAIAPNPSVARNKAIAALPAGPRKEIAQGIPTEADVSVNTAKGAEAETAIRGLADIVTPEQLRSYMHLLSPDAAKIAEKVYLEKAQTELQQQDPQRVEAQMQSTIRRDVLKRLPRDPEFSRVADYAAVGGLGYLLQDLENSARFAEAGRSLNTEKIKLVTAVTSQATVNYRQARQQWEAGLNQARREALGIEGSTISPAERAQKLNEVDKDYTTRNPMPQYSDFLDQSLNEGGLSKNDFQEAFRSLVHVPGAAAPDPIQKVTQMYQSGQLTDADIDASQKLTPAQKAQIKASKRRTP